MSLKKELQSLDPDEAVAAVTSYDIKRRATIINKDNDILLIYREYPALYAMFTAVTERLTDPNRDSPIKVDNASARMGAVLALETLVELAELAELPQVDG